MRKLKLLIALLLPAFSAVAQTYSVGHTSVTYTDPARGGRSILTEIYYPASTAGTSVAVAPGAFPVIVFGHGFVMSWDAYGNFWNDLVPKGYIIAFPRTEGNFSPVHSEFGKDLAFLVNKLQSEGAVASSVFYNHISLHSAIMGHSMGGGSAFLAVENNVNVTTMVSFAAANTTPSSIDAASGITIPTLIFAAENDCVAPPATHQTPMYDSLASSCKAYIGIKGGAHCEFADYNFNCSFGQSTCSPQPAISGAAQKDVVSDLLNLWLAYYLKDDCFAIDHFNDSLASSPRINAVQSCSGNMTPVITNNGGVLQSTGAANYQWFLDGNPITAETNQTLSATVPGNYYVSVSYLSSTCEFVSNVISIAPSGLDGSTNSALMFLSPNPVKERMLIKIAGTHCKKMTIRIIDASGVEIDTHEFRRSETEGFETVLDVGLLVPGLYCIQLIGDDKTTTKKFIKD
ncbi:MAG: hypothetical protein K0Q95_107 [Bacteroidota bacterium]|jgi:dienelactone hydrolase|nr:hypothetical protein [Bacteroidota bacterium]